MARRAVEWARSDVLWCLAGFCLLQAGLALVVEWWRPGLRDLEYGAKLDLLRQERRRHPGRPLALMLGSSRVFNGLRPDLLPEYRGPGGPALVFNFGLTGHGPLHQLLCLRRLLAVGERPRWLFVEVLPSLLPLDWQSEDLVRVERLGWADLGLLRRYGADPWRLYGRWLGARAVPWFTCRFCLLNRYRPSWVPWGNRAADVWNTMDGLGWLGLPPCEGPAEQARALEGARREHVPALEQFHVAGVPDRALRELAALCRREGIAVTLFLMPEGERFRGWYPAAARARLEAYLEALRGEVGVPVVDARGWVPEAGFRDSHHLLPEGAALFTERFGREVLGPAVTGR